MKRRVDACAEIYKRIKDNRVAIGLKTFRETPTDQAKVEDMPVCFMLYGTDSIIKRSARSASRIKGQGNTRSVEVILELVAKKADSVQTIFEKVRDKVLADIHPIKDVSGNIDMTTFMVEDRTEGPVGYGLPDVEAMVFVINLVYLDE
jgi:hypothetical protein